MHYNKGVEGGIDEILCGAPKAGFEHIWWDCPAPNGVVNFGLQKIEQRRAKEGHKPACFWLAGIVPSAWTTYLSGHGEHESCD
eukprot:1960030-Heterocapsa_arctica.AAC.1